MNGLKILALVFGAMVLGVGAFAGYQYTQNKTIESEIASLRKAHTALIQQAEAREEATNARIDRRLADLPDAQDTATALITQSADALVVQVAKVLVSDPAKIDALRGPQGRSPSAEEAAAALMSQSSDALVAQVAKALVSDTAKVDALRGPPGKSPSAEDAAVALMSQSAEAFVSQITKALVLNPRYRAALRGLPGETPSAEDIAKSILIQNQGATFEAVSDALWGKYGETLASAPALVAATAQYVVENYATELAPAQSSSLSATALAEALAKDRGFADMVARLVPVNRLAPLAK